MLDFPSEAENTFEGLSFCFWQLMSIVYHGRSTNKGTQFDVYATIQAKAETSGLQNLAHDAEARVGIHRSWRICLVIGNQHRLGHDTTIAGGKGIDEPIFRILFVVHFHIAVAVVLKNTDLAGAKLLAGLDPDDFDF